MPMDKDEFRRVLDGLELSQAEFARIVDAGARTGRRWALGGSIPGSVEVLLCLLRDRPELLSLVKDIRTKRSAPPARAKRPARAA